MTAPVCSIALLGDGAAGWLAALLLRRALPAVRIAIVACEGEDDGVGPLGPAETLPPGFGALLAGLGVEEDALLRAARGGFSLGTVFSGWAGPEADWFLPYGDVGAPLGPVAFQHLAARLRAAGQPVRLADFSLAAVAAAAGRFDRPATDPRSILSSYDYGLHVDCAGLAALLREAAGGIERHAVPFRRALVGEEGIEAVELADGSRVAADLWLDCSGPSALLANAVGAGWESWAEWLPCDRVAASWTGVEGVPPPYGHAGAHPGGWLRTVPLAGGQGRVLFHASAHLAAQLGAVPFAQGRRTRVWAGNCVALGAAAMLAEPLHGHALAHVRSGVERLVALLPAAPGGPEPAEYNRLAANEADRVRDFAILPWKTNGRLGEPLWDAARAMAVPETLQYKLDLYASRGRVPMYDDETFDRPDWIAVLDGQAVRPRRWDALADAIPEPVLGEHFARLRALVVEAVRAMPPHGATLRRIGVIA